MAESARARQGAIARLAPGRVLSYAAAMTQATNIVILSGAGIERDVAPIYWLVQMRLGPAS